MKKIIACLLIAFIAAIKLSAQYSIEVYPTNWWVGMKNPKLQVMLHGNGIANATGFAVSYPGVTLNKITKAKNKNYVFLDLTIASTAKPGSVAISVKGISSLSTINYTLPVSYTH